MASNDNSRIIKEAFIKTDNNIENYTISHQRLVKSIVRGERLASNSFVLISKNVEEYVSGKKSKLRIILVILTHMCCLITCKRGALLSLMNRVNYIKLNTI